MNLETISRTSLISATGLTLLLLTTLTIAGCNSKELPSQWASRPITVDGKLGDWAGMKLTDFEKDGFSVGIANDTSRLYLMLRTHDGSIVRTIRMTGLQLWFNAEGDKKTGFGVKLRGGPSFGLMRRPPGGENMNDPERQERREEFERRRPMRDTTMVFTFIDEKQYINMDIPPDGSLGPAIAVDTSEGFYTYEFSIPLQKSQVRYFGIGAEPPRKIEVGAIWGEIDRAAMQQRGRGMHAGFGGEGPTEGGMPGDGGFGGGRGGGRFGGYGGGFHRPEIKKVDLWFKTTLAARQL